MKKIIISSLLFLLMSSVSLLHAQLTPAVTDRLNTVLDSVCNKYHIKGASAALLVPGAGTWKGVFGESHSGMPVQDDMLFGIGDNTETYIAALMLKMQENQLLDLDDSIGKWIHNVTNVNGKITIRQMLQHSSGLFNYTDFDFFYHNYYTPNRIYTKEDMLPNIDAPYFSPGTGWKYSKTNYLLAGMIVEKVLNKPVQAALRDLILLPNGLTQTIYHPQETSTLTIPHNWSYGYFWEPFQRDLFSDPAWSNNAHFSIAGPAGAMMQTAEDNVKFWNRLLSGQVISKASLDEMLSFRTLPANAGYGLGLYRYKNTMNGRSFYTRGGTIIGFISENMVDTTSGICISVLTNQDSISNQIIRNSLVGALHKVTLQMNITGVGRAVDQVRVGIYPNPAMDVVNVDMREITGSINLRIFDISGKLALEKVITGSENISTIGLEQGLYIVYMTSEAGNYSSCSKLQIIK